MTTFRPLRKALYLSLSACAASAMADETVPQRFKPAWHLTLAGQDDASRELERRAGQRSALGNAPASWSTFGLNSNARPIGALRLQLSNHSTLMLKPRSGGLSLSWRSQF